MDDLLAKPIETPLTYQEDKVATSLVRRKLAHSGSHDGLLHFKTGGQVFLRQHTLSNNIRFVIAHHLCESENLQNSVIQSNLQNRGARNWISIGERGTVVISWAEK